MFKEVGDTTGHPNGPRVLETVEVTTAAKTLLRKKGAKGNQKKNMMCNMNEEKKNIYKP